MSVLKPQSEVLYNKFLPYSDQLNVDTLEFLVELKKKLGKAVCLRELRVGAGRWTERLVRFIELYGKRFSKEDHVAYVKVMYELMTLPDLEPVLLNFFSMGLTSLLSKKEQLTREDLSLPWEPLFEVCRRLFIDQSATKTYQYHEALPGTVTTAVSYAKFYFPTSATAEILERLRPNLCPFDQNVMSTTVAAFEWFLPVALPPENSHLGYKLWLSEFMNLWEIQCSARLWEPFMMTLISQLASHNIGYIDWEPYMTFMYSRFLRSFSLPITYKKIQVSNGKNLTLGISDVSLWIICTLGGNSCGQYYFHKLMSLLEVYFYPTNFGRHTVRLMEFLHQLMYFFVRRLHIERVRKDCWDVYINDGWRLTEDDIDKFVATLRPIVLNAIYSKVASLHVHEVCRLLATLRPRLIIVPIIEKFYKYEDCQTEPHKLLTTMACLVSLIRPMVEGRHQGFPEGPGNLISLMENFLPGIDSNDMKKTLTALLFYSMAFTMIPLVDCSKAGIHWNDLTEVEELLCGQTAQFEDFVVRFMDQCFIVISANDNSNRVDQSAPQHNMMEESLERSFFVVFSSLLMQSSREIFSIALKKLVTYIKSNIFEPGTASYYVGAVCQAYAQVNPKETLNELLPYLTSEIFERLDVPGVELESNLDHTFLYHMSILAKTVCTPGFLPHVAVLTQVLDRTLHLGCKKSRALACKVLSNMMIALCLTSPVENRSIPQSFDADIKDYLPIRDWGKFSGLDNLEVNWYVPGEDEIKAVDTLVSKYLLKEIDFLTEYVGTDCEINRDVLHTSLDVVLAVLNCRPLLPMWDEPTINVGMCSSELASLPLPRCKSLGSVTMPGGGNVRKTLADLMHCVLEKLLKDSEDDTESFKILTSIFSRLLQRCTGNYDMNVSYTQFRRVKRIQRNVLAGDKKYVRSILIQRLRYQHAAMEANSTKLWTETHLMIVRDLMKLTVSRYTEVRKKAQEKVVAVIENFDDAFHVVTDDIIKYLAVDPNKHHEQFKGILYLAMGTKSSPILMFSDWHHISRLWPALVNSRPSEKESIMILLKRISSTMGSCFPTVGISLEVTDRCVEAAKALCNDPEVLEKGIEIAARRKELNISCYRKLEASLLDSLDKPDLHRRLRKVAISFLCILSHPEIDFSDRSVTFFTEALVNENLSLRKNAIRTMVYVLKQQKGSYTRIPVDPTIFNGGANSLERLKPGVREDNQWLVYNSKKNPVTAEEWDQAKYVHKPHIGYYAWPREILVYAPANFQPNLDRPSSDLSIRESIIHNFFCDPEKVQKLMSFLSLEENKDYDKFNAMRYMLFKSLFRNCGDRYLENFWKYLDDFTKMQQESSQRAACEIIAGLIRGSKNWPYEKISRMWEKLLPLISQGLNNIMQETANDWGICIATAVGDRDPRRVHWLLEHLMIEPIREEASHISCGRLYALHGAASQNEWKMSEFHQRILDFIKPFLDYEYDNVRSRIGNLMSTLFMVESMSIEESPQTIPRVLDLVDYILPKLEILMEPPECIDTGVEPGSSQLVEELIKPLSETEIHDKASEQGKTETTLQKLANKRQSAIRLLKTVCKWIIASENRSPFGMSPHLFKFLPLLCLMETAEGDEELLLLCSNCLSVLCSVNILPQHIPVTIDSLKIVASSYSWTARVSALNFIQPFLFQNVFIWQMNDSWILEIVRLVLNLLEDEWSDVRVKASETLCILFLSKVIKDVDSLLEDFKQRSSYESRRKSRGETVATTLRLRHSGILGLCAFIDAHPYTMPDGLKNLLVFLSEHFYDPAPIPATIFQCLTRFKASHHSMMTEMEVLSDELLELLAEVPVPPSYIV